MAGCFFANNLSTQQPVARWALICIISGTFIIVCCGSERGVAVSSPSPSIVGWMDEDGMRSTVNAAVDDDEDETLFKW